MDDQLAVAINGYLEFATFVRRNNLVALDRRVADFIGTLDSLSHVCGCVHRTIHDRARDMYARSLPLIQADNAAFFVKAKEAAKGAVVIFRDGDLELLRA